MTRRGGGAAALVGVLLLFITAGCGGDGDTTGSGVSSEADVRSELQGAEAPSADTVTPSHCPAGLPDCRTTEGRIVYVERVDPDGDGDAHFVIADPQGITLRGLTAIDVRKGLRPKPLPGVGELISAAGRVQTGSYGQSQIHAIELHVAGR